MHIDMRIDLSGGRENTLQHSNWENRFFDRFQRSYLHYRQDGKKMDDL